MKKVHIITLLMAVILSLPLSAKAQFNTIGRVKSSKPKTPVQETESVVIEDTTQLSNERDNIPIQHEANMQWIHPPLKGKLKITSPFGRRRNPFDKRKTEYHSGLDLAAQFGTPAYAMMSGEVVSVGYDQRAGHYIKLKHGSFTITYCHLLSRPILSIGAPVIAGHPIGQVGSSGRSTGPHLHLTLKRNGQVIDPAIMLRYFKLI